MRSSMAALRRLRNPSLALLLVASLHSFPSLAQEAAQIGVGQPVLDAASLTQAAAVRRGFEAKDEFDATPKLPWGSRSFKIRYAFGRHSLEMCPGAPTWDYDAEDGNLTLRLGGSYMLRQWYTLGDEPAGVPFPDGDLHYTLNVFCSQQKGGSYRIENLFGAQRSLTRMKITRTSLHDNGVEVKEIFGRHRSIPMAAEKARSMAPRLVLEIEGSLGEWSDGNSLICGVKRDDPDFTSVYDATEHACVYRARITKVAVVDPVTGETLLAEDVT